MKHSLLVVGLCLLVAVAAAVAIAGGRSTDPLGISVSPHTLILGMDQGAVSAHTDIPLSKVDRESIKLNGIAAVATGADARGCLVASFDEDEIKAIVTVPSATLTLTGSYLTGETFSGSDTVRVTQSRE